MSKSQLNVGNVRIYGGMADGVYLAPLGTADPEPMTLSDLILGPKTPYRNVGWLMDDGVPFGQDVSVDETNGHQGGSLLRMKMKSSKKTVQLGMAEDSPFTSSIYWGHDGKVVSTGTDLAKVTIPEAPKGQAFKAVVVLSDNEEVVSWYVIDRLEVGEREEMANNNTDISGYQVSCAAVGEIRHITNAPSYVAEIAPSGSGA